MAPPLQSAVRGSKATKCLELLLELVACRIEALTEARSLPSEGGDPDDEKARFMSVADAHKKTISAASDSYARAWNAGFANKMMHSLPPELRMMIHEALVQTYNPNSRINEIDNDEMSTNGDNSKESDENDNDFDEVEEDHSISLRRSDPEPRIRKFGERRNVRTYALLNADDYPHYFNKAYMGLPFASELSAVFHVQGYFEISHQAEVTYFLANDRFATDCVPSSHVKYLGICLTLNNFNVKTGQEQKWSSTKFNYPLQRHFVAAVKALGMLKLVQPKRGAQISLSVDCGKKDYGPKFTEALVPFVYGMKAKGWVVEVKGSYAYDIEIDPQDFKYDVPEADWIERIKSNSIFASEDVNAAIKEYYGEGLRGYW